MDKPSAHLEAKRRTPDRNGRTAASNSRGSAHTPGAVLRRSQAKDPATARRTQAARRKAARGCYGRHAGDHHALHRDARRIEDSRGLPYRTVGEAHGEAGKAAVATDRPEHRLPPRLPVTDFRSGNAPHELRTPGTKLADICPSGSAASQGGTRQTRKHRPAYPRRQIRTDRLRADASGPPG